MYQRILVPIDGSTTSNRALTAAIGLAQAFKGRLRLIYVVDEAAYVTGYDPSGGYSGELLRVMRESGEKILQEGLAFAKAAGIEADTMLFDTFGERLGEVVAKAVKLWNADLVVVGTHGRRGFSRLLLGSGAEQVIRLAPVPVLAIRSAEEDVDGQGG
ncbi:MAG: universal stress protein [Pseudomonadota bacterium]